MKVACTVLNGESGSNAADLHNQPTENNMITNNDMLLAFGLTLIAGLSTGIGSLIALLSKKDRHAFPVRIARTIGRSHDLCIIHGINA